MNDRKDPTESFLTGNGLPETPPTTSSQGDPNGTNPAEGALPGLKNDPPATPGRPSPDGPM